MNVSRDPSIGGVDEPISEPMAEVRLAGADEDLDRSLRPRRLADFVNLLVIAIPAVLLLLPQFFGVLQQAEIIVGHAFVTHEGKKRGLFDAVVQHTRHLKDFPIQWVLIILANCCVSKPG